MSATGQAESAAATLQIPVYETLLVTIEEAVATVSLNRPDKANSMNLAMWSELQACFEWIDEQPSIRVAILAANGKHFCAGLDLSIFAALSSPDMEAGRAGEAIRRTILRMQDNLSAIEKCRKPVLAAIHHTCIGGGIDMTTCCDMRYCTEDAYFSVKEIDLGMTADVGTLQRLPRIIGDGMMRELAYTGRRLEAREARELGLVNRVYPDREALVQGVTKIAREIASKSPLAVRGSKEMILYARDHSVADGLNYIATWNAGIMSQADLGATMHAQASGEAPEYED